MLTTKCLDNYIIKIIIIIAYLGFYSGVMLYVCEDGSKFDKSAALARTARGETCGFDVDPVGHKYCPRMLDTAGTDGE